MGLKKFLLKEIVPGYRRIELANDIKEHGIISGIKEHVRREVQEDNPLTAAIYNNGKVDGKKEGYVAASAEYEKKLLEQVDLFLNQKNFLNNKEMSMKNSLMNMKQK